MSMIEPPTPHPYRHDPNLRAVYDLAQLTYAAHRLIDTIGDLTGNTDPKDIRRLIAADAWTYFTELLNQIDPQ